MATSGVQRCPGGVNAGTQPSAPADERAWRYAEVQCARCGAVVEVAKFSLQHTSVQWTVEAVLTCAEFAACVAAGGSSALVATCASLRAGIDAAVTDGRVEVLPP
jgi:hypothetical protein